MVHDWLMRLGGAERVLIVLHKIFPSAPIYTLFYDEKFVSQYLPGAEIIPSFLQKVPGIKKIHPWLKLLMPSAMESLDLSPPKAIPASLEPSPSAGGFDVVISSSHEIAHGVLLKPGTGHISYYHSPSRLLWDRAHDYVEDFRKGGRSGLKLSLIKAGQHFLRLWDWQAGQRPDIVLANSKHVAGRIKKYYGREAKVVYPPVTSVWQYPARSFSRSPTDNYFLIVSQLYPHKNIDLAIKAFKGLPGLNLLVIGDGPEKKRLKKLIRDSRNIKLAGFVSDEKLPSYYGGCLAYLILNEEDFGISPIEAMSFGKPVLAFRAGGARETVLESITGEFFDKLEPAVLVEAVKSINQKIKSGYYGPMVIKKYSEKFGFERFKKEILDLVSYLGYNKKTV